MNESGASRVCVRAGVYGRCDWPSCSVDQVKYYLGTYIHVCTADVG